MTSVSAAADRRCHLAVDIWGFLLRRCTKTGTLGAEAEVFEGAQAPLIHVRRISDIRRILQLTHSGRYRLPCRRMLCNQHYCTVYCPRRSYSACFFSYGICQCFWFWGPREGKDRLLLAETVRANPTCCLSWNLSFLFSRGLGRMGEAINQSLFSNSVYATFFSSPG